MRGIHAFGLRRQCEKALPSALGTQSVRAMGKKRPSERVSKKAEAAAGPKRPRAGSLSPVDSAFEPIVQGRAHGSSTTPLKAILEDYAEQQR